MKKTNNLAYFCITFILFNLFNFYCSNLISLKLEQGMHFSNQIIHLNYVKNTGAAFSILQNSTNFLMILSIIAFCALFFYIIKNLNTLKMKEIFFLSILISGILGNFYERFFFGYVRDYFELTFINFPIFNISDTFINIGVFGIIVLLLLTKKPIKIL